MPLKSPSRCWILTLLSDSKPTVVRPINRQIKDMKRLVVFGAALLLGINGQAADWPIFRGNRGLTGIAQGKLTSKLSLLWKFDAKGPVKAAAVIGG